MSRVDVPAEDEDRHPKRLSVDWRDSDNEVDLLPLLFKIFIEGKDP